MHDSHEEAPSWLIMATCHWSFNEKHSTVVFFIKVFSSNCRRTASSLLLACFCARSGSSTCCCFNTAPTKGAQIL